MEKKLSDKTIKVQLVEMTAKTQVVKDKHENLLANASVSFKGELGEYFTITGFTVWKSKYGGYNVEVPRRKYFKYCLFEKLLWEKIKKAILESYEYVSMDIPV